MSCRQWKKYLAYLAFVLSFVNCVVLMVYIHSNYSTLPGLRSLIRNSSAGESIQLMDFNDLGNSKERVLLLVIVGSAPQQSDRRQAIRDTWWRHCTHSEVSTQARLADLLFWGMRRGQSILIPV